MDKDIQQSYRNEVWKPEEIKAWFWEYGNKWVDNKYANLNMMPFLGKKMVVMLDKTSKKLAEVFMLWEEVLRYVYRNWTYYVAIKKDNYIEIRSFWNWRDETIVYKDYSLSKLPMYSDKCYNINFNNLDAELDKIFNEIWWPKEYIEDKDIF